MENDSAYKENEYLGRPDLDLSESKKRAVHWFSIRDYSELELQKRLAKVTNPEVAAETLAWCHQQKLIKAPEAMTELIIEKLTRQKKGIEQINYELNKRGLSEITADPDAELEKAIVLMSKKLMQTLRTQPWSSLTNPDKQKTKAKVFRFLATRGFTSEIINSSFEKWLQTNKDTDDDEFD